MTSTSAVFTSPFTAAMEWPKWPCARPESLSWDGRLRTVSADDVALARASFRSYLTSMQEVRM